MPLPVRWLVFWSALLALFSIAVFLAHSDENPIPNHITSIKLNTQHLTLQRTPEGRWHNENARINNTQQMLIKRWITDFQKGCINHGYKRAEINDDQATQKDKLEVQINDKTYEFGLFNEYLGRHYLYQGNHVYLCEPTLKARLEHAYHLWITQHARTPRS